jgi:hypothetical protein
LAACDTGKFRKDLRQNGIDHLDSLIAEGKYFDRNIYISHTTLSDEQKRTRLMKRLDEIWKLGVVFDKGCNSDYCWTFEDITFPLAVLECNIEVVLYSDYNQLQGSAAQQVTFMTTFTTMSNEFTKRKSCCPLQTIRWPATPCIMYFC